MKKRKPMKKQNPADLEAMLAQMAKTIASLTQTVSELRVAGGAQQRSEPMGWIQLRVPDGWRTWLEQHGEDKSSAARDILGPFIEGEAYYPGKYGKARQSPSGRYSAGPSTLSAPKPAFDSGVRPASMPRRMPRIARSA